MEMFDGNAKLNLWVSLISCVLGIPSDCYSAILENMLSILIVMVHARINFACLSLCNANKTIL